MKHRDIEKELLTWQVNDGPYIHLVALKQALPGFRWDLYLIGITASCRPKQARTLPLLGRTRRGAVVVLMSSLRAWLTHYNPSAPELVEQMLEDLAKAERQYLARLNLIRAEVRAKSGDAPGRKPTPKPPKPPAQTRPKVTSTELFKVWG